MLKRTCDRCGTAVDNEWYELGIKRKTDSAALSLSALCTSSTIAMVKHTPDYCEACIRDIERFAEKKITRDME